MRGFTILEVILVIVLLALIVASVAPFFRTTIEGWDIKDRQLEVLQNGRVGMDIMVKKIKTAKQFSTADPDHIAFTDADDTLIEFSLQSGILEYREGGHGQWSELSEPVDSLAFIYYDKNCNVTTNPAEVRSVSISMAVSDPGGKVNPLTFNSQATLRKDYSSCQVAINEINYNPPGSGVNERQREWIELYNYGTEDIDMTGWQISSSGQTDDLFPGGATMTIPAAGYAIITANPTDVYTYYTVDPSAIRIETDDTRIGAGLGDNSDTVTILDSGGNSIGIVAYDNTWGGNGDGDTIERKDALGSPSDPANWEASSDAGTYTAGAANTTS